MTPDLKIRSMTRDALLARLAVEAETMARQRQARRLAVALARLLGITPAGIELICWIADSTCRANAEALAIWIECQLVDPEFQLAASHTPELDALAQRLIRRLNTMEASIAC
jgi:hypothetical protein